MSGNFSFVSNKAILADNVTIGRFCIIEDHVVLEEGVTVEDFSMVMKETKIGKNTRIGTYSKIGKRVTIGERCSFISYCEIRDDCKLGNNVKMGSRGTLSAGTIVEDDVIMKYSFVVADTPDLSRNDEKVAGILKKGSKFGANVLIMPAVTIGENSEIGACSQVRRNVPANEVWYGIPAKYYRKV